MKSEKSRLLSIMLFVCMVCSLLLQNITEKPMSALAEEADPSVNESTQKHTVWILGDSIAAAFTDQYYYPRYGWGTQLQRFIDSSKYEVVNLALSGRSSKSYVNNEPYKVFLDGMKEGDVVLLAFGHNDEKNETERYTNPNRSYLFDGSFQNTLYQKYIVPAQKKKCSVILCTPFVRRPQNGQWEPSDLHITSDVGTFEGGDYPQAIRDLGKTLNLPVVDLTTMSKEVYEMIGYDASVYLNSWTSEKARSVDNTHTNMWGAAYNAYLISKAIYSMKVPGISDAIKTITIKEPPRKETYLRSNPNYIVSQYDNNLPDSELWSQVGIWKGTVFGGIGDIKSAKNNFILEPFEKNGLHIAALNNSGRIGNLNDGFAMYYCRIPAGCDFTLSATAKVNRYVQTNQVSFGLMARDEMYIDQYKLDTLGDFVAAAPLVSVKDGNLLNCFARKDGILMPGGNCVNKISAGDKIQLKIQGTSDGFSTTFDHEAPVSGGFDFPLTLLDSSYIYVGMYVTRNADISFENIHLTIDGVEVTPANYTTMVPQPEIVSEPTPTVAVTPIPAPQKAVKVDKNPCTMEKISLKAKNPGELTVTWKKANVTGYQIAIARNAKFTKEKQFCQVLNMKDKKEQIQYSINNLKKGCSYYIKVRSYSIVDGKRVYGTFSKVHKITLK